VHCIFSNNLWHFRSPCFIPPSPTCCSAPHPYSVLFADSYLHISLAGIRDSYFGLVVALPAEKGLWGAARWGSVVGDREMSVSLFNSDFACVSKCWFWPYSPMHVSALFVLLHSSSITSLVDSRHIVYLQFCYSRCFLFSALPSAICRSVY
jgi:hypothetical protein